MAPEDIAFVLIPGSFSPPNFYHKVSALLRSKDYTVQECQLLSAVPMLAQREPPAKLEDDVLYIREVVQALLSQDKQVVVVMNSYAGFPGGEAVKGLSRTERPEGSMAVIGLVYLSSFLPPKGSSLRSMLGDYLFEPLKSGEPGKYMILPAEAAQGIFSDHQPENQQRYFSQMLLHSSDSFDGKTTYEAYKDIPSWYVKCEGDMIVPPSLQQEMVDVANKNGGKVKTVSAPGASHVIHTSQPETVVRVLEEAAGITATGT